MVTAQIDWGSSRTQDWGKGQQCEFTTATSSRGNFDASPSVLHRKGPCIDDHCSSVTARRRLQTSVPLQLST